MLNLDEDALICDLAETYQVYDYGSLPLKLVATLSAGLRENSRIMMKLADMPASQNTILLASIADRIDAFRFMFADIQDEPPTILGAMFGIENKKKSNDGVKVFATTDAFNAELERLRGI